MKPKENQIFVCNHPIKAIIFDMDGTLIDSTSIWADIDKAFFNRRGYDKVPDGYVQEIVHMGLIKGAQMTKERYGLATDTEEGIIKEWRDASHDYYANKIPLKEGAIELLELLKTLNIPLALATANDRELYRLCLTRLKLEKYFDYIIDVNQAKQGKSSPEIYNQIKDKFGFKESEIAVLEDTIVGLSTSFKAGYYAIAVYDKASEPIDDLKHQNSHLYINNFFELIKSIKS